MLYINFPKKGVAQTFLRGRSTAGFRRRLSGPRINVWATPFFGKLKGKNWKEKRVEERMQKCLLRNAMRKNENSKLRMQNAMWKKENSKCEMPWKKKFQVRRAQTKRYFQGRLNIASKPKIWVITDETFHLDLQDLHVLYNSYQWFPKPVSFFISTRFFELKWRRDLQGWQQVVNQLQSCLYSEIVKNHLHIAKTKIRKTNLFSIYRRKIPYGKFLFQGKFLSLVSWDVTTNCIYYMRKSNLPYH